MGQAKGKVMFSKITEKQLPKRDFKEALLMDMRSKIESI